MQSFPVDWFVDQAAIQQYVCAICTSVPRSPVDTPCGHLFCQQCLAEWVAKRQEEQQPVTCPTCRQALSSAAKLAIVNFIANAIQQQLVTCITEGCPEQMSPRALEAHFATCSFAPATCIQCKQSMLRSLLTHHQQQECKVKCKVCRQTYLVTDNHSSGPYGCAAYDPCPYGCKRSEWTEADIRKRYYERFGKMIVLLPPTTTMPVGTVIEQNGETHAKCCPAKPVRCTLCHTTVRRDKLEQHMTDNMVQHMLEINRDRQRQEDSKITDAWRQTVNELTLPAPSAAKAGRPRKRKRQQSTTSTGADERRVVVRCNLHAFEGRRDLKSIDSEMHIMSAGRLVQHVDDDDDLFQPDNQRFGDSTLYKSCLVLIDGAVATNFSHLDSQHLQQARCIEVQSLLFRHEHRQKGMTACIEVIDYRPRGLYTAGLHFAAESKSQPADHSEFAGKASRFVCGSDTDESVLFWWPRCLTYVPVHKRTDKGQSTNPCDDPKCQRCSKRRSEVGNAVEQAVIA